MYQTRLQTLGEILNSKYTQTMKRILFALVAIMMAVNVDAQKITYNARVGFAYCADDYYDAPGVDLEVETSIPLYKIIRFMPALTFDVPGYDVAPLVSLPLNVGVMLPVTRRSSVILKGGPCPLLSLHEGPGIGGNLGIDYSAKKFVVGLFVRVGDTDGEFAGALGISAGYRF